MGGSGSSRGGGTGSSVVPPPPLQHGGGEQAPACRYPDEALSAAWTFLSMHAQALDGGGGCDAYQEQGAGGARADTEGGGREGDARVEALLQGARPALPRDICCRIVELAGFLQWADVIRLYTELLSVKRKSREVHLPVAAVFQLFSTVADEFRPFSPSSTSDREIPFYVPEELNKLYVCCDFEEIPFILHSRDVKLHLGNTPSSILATGQMKANTTFHSIQLETRGYSKNLECPRPSCHEEFCQGFPPPQKSFHEDLACFLIFLPNCYIMH
ncbi:hypothetical protein Pelo_1705 [Pelomyxa schiedti]|nr:hypothetical protein Pelo_1705 [Pelomyxa schiedti]